MSTTYIPARLQEGNYAWYLIYYQTNPVSGKRERFRESHDLNRIPSVRERRKKARLIIKSINAKLPNGYPYEEAYGLHLSDFTVLEALEIAKDIKLTTDRKRTRDVIHSMCNIFTEFLEKKKYQKMKVIDFKKVNALEFLDYGVFDRKIGNRTYNNYIERIRALFMELLERDYIEKNPFSGLKKKKE